VQSQKTKPFLNIKNKYLQVSLKCLIAAAEIKTKRTLLTECRAKPDSRLSFFQSNAGLTEMLYCSSEMLYCSS
jgi:hypothetical protein